MVKENKAYKSVEGQNTLHTRYLLEDIPMGLVPMVSLGKNLGVNVDRAETITKLGEFLIERYLTTKARTVENLGLSEMTAGAILHFVESETKIRTFFFNKLKPEG